MVLVAPLVQLAARWVELSHNAAASVTGCVQLGGVFESYIHFIKAPRAEVGVMPGGDPWQDSALPCRCNLCCLPFSLLLCEWQNSAVV